MNQWVAFFVGTPQRFLGTLVAVAVIAGAIHPPLMARAVSNLSASINALVPLIGPLGALLLVLWGCSIMLRSIFGGGGGNSGGGRGRRP